KFGDSGHLAQESQTVETPLVDGAGRPRQLRSPTDLALDFADELADLGGGGLGLLALNADQGGLVLAVGEPDFEQAVAEQGHAHDGEEERDVLAEQRSADLAPAALFHNLIEHALHL